MKTVLIVVALIFVTLLFWHYQDLGILYRSDITPFVNKPKDMSQQTVKYILNGKEVGPETFADFKKLLTIDQSSAITGRTPPAEGTDKFGATASWTAVDQAGRTYEYTSFVTETEVINEIRRVSD